MCNMEKIYSKKYPDLSLFLGFSFNPDWICDYPTPEASIQGFVIQEKEKNVKIIYNELNSLLAEKLSSKELDDILLKDFDIYYDYRVDKISSTDWLEWVRDRIVYYAKQDKNLDLERERNE